MRGSLASGARLDSLATVDSTSSEARRRYDAGAAAPFWIMAGEQTAGYGRSGAPWSHGAGNLAASFLFTPDLPMQARAHLAFAAGLALIDAVADLGVAASAGKGARLKEAAGLSLKWPNDVMAGDAKLAGLLLESLGAPASTPVSAQANVEAGAQGGAQGGALGGALAGSAPMLLGIGVNVASAPAIAAYDTACLADLLAGKTAHSPGGGTLPTPELPTPERVLAAFDARFCEWRALLERQSFAALRPVWMARAYGLGAICSVTIGSAEVSGRFDGVDDHGRLCLTTDNGPQFITAGTVRFPGAAGARKTAHAARD